MTDADDDLEVIHGSGNVFADLGFADANIRQFKASIAANIIRALNEQDLTMKEAQGRTGFAAADFSRVRRAKLQRFSLDRLIAMLSKLDQGQDVVLSVEVRPRGGVPGSAAHPV